MAMGKICHRHSVLRRRLLRFQSHDAIARTYAPQHRRRAGERVAPLLGDLPDNAGDLLPNDFIVLLPLAFLSVQAAGQIVVSRFLGFSELTTVVLTSAYCDLVFDEKLFTAPPKQNPKRNRRVASMVVTALGAIAGGVLTKDGNISNALWISGATKVLIAAIWASWKSKGSVHLD